MKRCWHFRQSSSSIVQGALLQIQFCTEGIQEVAPATEVKQFAVGVLC
jgi:hypothetical protein